MLAGGGEMLVSRPGGEGSSNTVAAAGGKSGHAGRPQGR